MDVGLKKGNNGENERDKQKVQIYRKSREQ